MIKQWQTLRTQPIYHGRPLQRNDDQSVPPTPEQLLDDGRVDGIPARLASELFRDTQAVIEKRSIETIRHEVCGKGGGKRANLRPCNANGVRHDCIADAAVMHGVEPKRLRNLLYTHKAIVLNGVVFRRHGCPHNLKPHHLALQARKGIN